MFAGIILASKLTDLMSKWWWVPVVALVVVIAIMVLIIKYKNYRIRKLREKLNDSVTQLKITEEKIALASSCEPETVELGYTDDEESIFVTREFAVSENADAADKFFNEVQTVEHKNSGVKFTVAFDRQKLSWVIRKQGVKRVVRRLDTKQEAMQIARELCKKYDAQLVVHKRDGKFQKQ